MKPSLLTVRGLGVELASAHGWVQALRDVSFSLERGATLGLVGESGCGKSLTALALLGLLPEGARLSGSIRLDGQELVGLGDAALCKIRGKRIAMVFQEPMGALNPVQRIGQQVAEPLRLHGGLGAKAARAEAQELLERVGIANAGQRLDQYPHQFSGGQRQRIGLAMALAGAPDLLLADEPTTALDASVQKQMLALIQSLVAERGMALLLVSHDLGLIADNVAQLLVMYGGSVVESGPSAAVFAASAHPYSQGLLAARPSLAAWNSPRPYPRLPMIHGSVPALADLPPGCPFAGRCAYRVDHCAASYPPAVLARASGADSVDSTHRVRCLRLDAVAAAQPKPASPPSAP